MFVPCEGIGSAVARIVKETGMSLSSMEFTEDRCTVVFGQVRKAAAMKEQVLKGAHTLPYGPWKPTGKKTRDGISPRASELYSCGEVKATIAQIAEDIGEHDHGKVRSRLEGNGGYSVPMKYRKREDESTGARMALA